MLRMKRQVSRPSSYGYEDSLRYRCKLRHVTLKVLDLQGLQVLALRQAWSAHSAPTYCFKYGPLVVKPRKFCNIYIVLNAASHWSQVQRTSSQHQLVFSSISRETNNKEYGHDCIPKTTFGASVKCCECVLII